MGRVDRGLQTTLSSFLTFIFSVELKDFKCANAKYDIKQAGTYAQVSRFAVVLLIVSIPGCQFMAFQMPFLWRACIQSADAHSCDLFIYLCPLLQGWFGGQLFLCTYPCVCVSVCACGMWMRFSNEKCLSSLYSLSACCCLLLPQQSYR